MNQQLLFAVLLVVLAAQKASPDNSNRVNQVDDELERLRRQHPELNEEPASSLLTAVVDNAQTSSIAAPYGSLSDHPKFNDNPLGLQPGELEVLRQKTALRRSARPPVSADDKPQPFKPLAPEISPEERERLEHEQANRDLAARAGAGGTGANAVPPGVHVENQNPDATGTGPGTGTPPPANVPVAPAGTPPVTGAPAGTVGSPGVVSMAAPGTQSAPPPTTPAPAAAGAQPQATQPPANQPPPNQPPAVSEK